MLLSRVLLYSSISFLTACAVFDAPQATITPSPAPTATVDWSGQKELTLYGTGEYGIPPFEALEATTLDGEFVTIDITLLFSVSPSLIGDVDLNNWDDYLANKVIPAIRETVAVVIVQYAAREIYGERRLDVNDHLQMKLTSNLSDYGINVQDVLVRDVAFTSEFNNKVEQEIITTMTAEAQFSITPP